MNLTVQKSFRVGAKTPVPAKAVEQRPAPQGRIPRITRLMALAIKFDGYIRDGVVRDYADLARLGHVTRARITQIMDLNLLAPDIQHSLLVLPRTISGRDPVRERHVRSLVSIPSWPAQRTRWRSLMAQRAETK
jgi:hypothetical protein